MATKPITEVSRNFGLGWARWVPEAGLLLVLPLVFYRGFAEQFTYTKVVLAQVLVFLGLAGWAVGLVWGKVHWPDDFRLRWPLGFFIAVILVSCWASDTSSFSFGEAEYFLCGPIWLILLVSWRKGSANIQAIGGLVAAAGTTAAGIALMQWTGHDPLLFGGYSVQWGTMVSRMRLYSTFGNPNFLCGYLIGAIFPAVALTLIAKRRIWRMVCGAASAVMLGVIAGTRSYGGWAALALGALAMAFVFFRSQKQGGRTMAEKNGAAKAIHLSLAPIGLVAAALISSIDQTLATRIAGRLYLSRIAWHMFLDHPILGSGWGTFQLGFLNHQASFLAAHPGLGQFWTNAWELHNDPLQLLVESGLLGFAGFVWLLVAYGREVRRAARVADSRASIVWLSASAGGAVAILADSLVNFQFSVAPTLVLFFTFLGFPYLLETRAKSPTSEAETHEQPAASFPFAWRALGGIGVAALCAALLMQTSQRALGELAYQRGINLESRGDWQGAEQADRDGIAAAPANGRLHFALARVLYIQQKYPEALREIPLAEPTYSDSHLMVLKARILDRMGRSTEALESFRRALELDPTLKTVQPDIDRLQR